MNHEPIESLEDLHRLNLNLQANIDHLHQMLRALNIRAHENAVNTECLQQAEINGLLNQLELRTVDVLQDNTLLLLEAEVRFSPLDDGTLSRIAQAVTRCDHPQARELLVLINERMGDEVEF